MVVVVVVAGTRIIIHGQYPKLTPRPPLPLATSSS
jgi:hypothetical protein